ncbi:hypothetical protein ABZT47_07995 [Sphaerisporangium sp. NPDC005289]|uniref:hypothetical protein n=1 Tax=Sphaerisporangium sp. NPDC005289 TaxID=3155247 RepID=UPI0033A2DAFD
MTALHPARSLRKRGSDADADVVRTDAIIDALAGRRPLDQDADPVVGLLQALARDVDQRLSSVSITPST